MTRREVILRAMSVARFWTAKQLGAIVDPGKGKPTSIVRYRKTHLYPAGYDDVIKLLPQLQKEGLVKRHPRKSEYEPTLWSLPGHKKPISPLTRQHYIDTTNLLVAYWQPQHWDEKWLEADHENYEIDSKVPMYDARMKKWDKVIYWEVDRGTEEMDVLYEKVDKYIAFCERHNDNESHVVFTLQYFRFGEEQSDAQRLKKLKERSYALLDYLAQKRRGNQFLVAWHDQVLATPYGDVFVTPLKPESASSLEFLTSAS